jgi:hypothetical protein
VSINRIGSDKPVITRSVGSTSKLTPIAGSLTVPATTDAATAALVGDTASLTGTALAASIDALASRIDRLHAAPEFVTLTDEGIHDGFPGFAVAPNGDFVGVYREAVSHDPPPSPAGVIKMRRSTDQGRTWSVESTIISDTNDCRDPMLAVLADDRMVLQFFKRNSTVGVGVFLSFSSNNGLTWGTPVEVPSVCSSKACSGFPVETGGFLVIPYYGLAGGKWSVRVRRSSDGGATFGPEIVVADGVAQARNFDECNLGVLPGGGLMALIRCDDTLTKGTYRAVSADNGATWSTPTLVIEGLSGRPAWITLASGAVLLLARRRTDQAHAMTLSWDEGLTWQTPLSYGEVPTGGYSIYAQAVELERGVVGVLLASEGVPNTSSILRFQHLLDDQGVSPFGELVIPFVPTVDINEDAASKAFELTAAALTPIASVVSGHPYTTYEIEVTIVGRNSAGDVYARYVRYVRPESGGHATTTVGSDFATSGTTVSFAALGTSGTTVKVTVTGSDSWITAHVKAKTGGSFPGAFLGVAVTML